MTQEVERVPRAYDRRMTEMVIYHAHIGVAFPAYHVRTEDQRIYECSQCGQEIRQDQAADVDLR